MHRPCIPRNKLLSFLMRFSLNSIILVSIIYVIIRCTDQPFFDNAMGNLLATLIGVIIGIPIAIWIDRLRQKEQEDREIRKLRSDALTRKHRILALIRQELEFNYEIVTAYTKEVVGDQNRPVCNGGCKDELWAALSDGGELEGIKDLDLMHAISFAYHYIRRLIYLDRTCLQYRFFFERDSLFSSQVRSDFDTCIGELMQKAGEHIKMALDSIDENLKCRS